jgi:hypothetical protein
MPVVSLSQLKASASLPIIQATSWEMKQRKEAKDNTATTTDANNENNEKNEKNEQKQTIKSKKNNDENESTGQSWTKVTQSQIMHEIGQRSPLLSTSNGK